MNVDIAAQISLYLFIQAAWGQITLGYKRTLMRVLTMATLDGLLFSEEGLRTRTKLRLKSLDENISFAIDGVAFHFHKVVFGPIWKKVQ